ncbi:hypothetical protein Mp_4g08360 [Marchantia polymorpha subsp. ruderalis]|uniref:Uncharacterized protein n=2 Tax=Marchantia polymorpha TaxID=3197 RepID=A0AAF6B7R1_MARPO|nr:hypothetical protein MARPO_0120s0010 [Marchantia polymorpha]BBN08045.1 hypothetical protein Mp_4g08360 [Marchantia polymorpha subsp. ruderalis]|eukprot:PTQ30727.1 hypothetical protein MARPO_0120s0010 [Marchantia polymorpha]
MYTQNFYRRPPPGPRRWSVETTPPRSEQGLEFGQQGVQVSDEGNDPYDFPARKPPTEEKNDREIKPETCLFEEWYKEEPKPTEVDAEKDLEEEGLKLCWETPKAKKPKPEIGPADWTPCFMVGFDMGSTCKAEPDQIQNENDVEPKVDEYQPYDHDSHSDLNNPDPPTEDTEGDNVDSEIAREIEETPPEPALPELPPFWQAPVGVDWDINHEAVQRQLELLPNRPGWVKAEWLKNEKYLRLNLQTMLQMNISSVAGLKLRARPPIDWTHQFLLVPDRLDFGTVEYGTISMKVAFLQNYHGTNGGRFRFEDLGPCCRILCEYGMVPPGLYRTLRVFFRADRLGSFNHEIKVLTQYDIFRFPIIANVVRPKAYEGSNHQQST